MAIRSPVGFFMRRRTLLLLITLLLLLVVGGAYLSWRMARRAVEITVEEVTKPEEKTIDLGALVTQVREMSRLETASMRVVHVSTITQSYKLIPDAVAGDEMTFLAAGDVVAGVDLSSIQQKDVWREPDGTIVLRLPPSTIFMTRVDNKESKVVNRKTGLLRRADVNLESRVRQHAEQAIRNEAVKKGILLMASQNAERKLAEMHEKDDWTDVRGVKRNESHNANGQILHQVWQEPPGSKWALAFSPDGRMLFSGGADGALRVWDLRTGREQAALIALGSAVAEPLGRHGGCRRSHRRHPRRAPGLRRARPPYRPHPRSCRPRPRSLPGSAPRRGGGPGGPGQRGPGKEHVAAPGEATVAVEQLSHDEHRPGVADDRQGPGDRTDHGEPEDGCLRACRHRHRPQILGIHQSGLQPRPGARRGIGPLRLEGHGHRHPRYDRHPEQSRGADPARQASPMDLADENFDSI